MAFIPGEHEGMHKAWMAHRPQVFVKRDRRLRFAALSIIVIGSLLSMVAHRMHWDRTLGIMMIATFFGAFGVFVLAQRLFSKHYRAFLCGNVDQYGVFLFCLKCSYPLHGCAEPRSRCPECGAAVWQNHDFLNGVQSKATQTENATSHQHEETPNE